MVAPLAIAGIGLMAGGTALSSYYDLKKAYETRKYWNDYYKHTGVRAKYPYRTGYYDIYKAYGSAMKGAGATAFGVAKAKNVDYDRVRNALYW